MEDRNLSTRYDASAVESRCYEAWEAAGLFQPDEQPGKPVFSITIPPPNITGSLHMGHALCYPIQDAVGRFRRLMGDSVMILPGQDHAGIATQSVVAKQLRSQGIQPASLGREAFVERVWEWRRESGNTILNQLRRLGCAFDWARERFTLDPEYVDAVLDVFVEWYDRGWVYLGERVVNWDPVLETSVSDIETERKTIRGKLYHVRYEFEDGSGSIVVATTRPETILGDVAVAVHPSDKRYEGLVGKTLVLPLTGRKVPLIADTYPDPAFGTGAVKITPAHDANDFEVGQRHGLPSLVVLDTKARMSQETGVYAGMDRFEARKRIVSDLEEAGLLEKVEDHEIAILVSERSGEPVEPLLREEWFVRQMELAAPAIKAVEDGRIKFVPERYGQIYLEWMRNLRDWNISRNLWWGHRIPVFYSADGRMAAGRTAQEAEGKLGAPVVRQDERVLDTWFSSGLWPFATLGWPHRTEDLERYYPTSVLVTSREILYLWVARMAMMGLDFIGEVPFREVYIYATVQTESGQRMSKSLGTGVDPMTIIETKGADALRYTLFSQTGYNQDIRYSDKRTDDARNLCNKMWNATRFILMHVDAEPHEVPSLDLVDRWLLSKLARTQASVRTAYETYNLQAACAELYSFFWSDLCDWYIEASKSRLESGLQAPRWVLLRALEAFLTMMHPVMPHITEELYQHLPLNQRSSFLMSSSWPQGLDDYVDSSAESEVERALEVTRSLRSLRAELGIAPMKHIPLAFFSGDLQGVQDLVQSQAWVQELAHGAPPQGQRALFATVAGVDLHLPLGEDFGPERLEAEMNRLRVEIAKVEKERAGLESRLSNPQFAERAKPEVVAEAREQLEHLADRMGRLQDRLEMFAG